MHFHQHERRGALASRHDNSHDPARLWAHIDPARLNGLWHGLVQNGVRAMGTPAAEAAVRYVEQSLRSLPLDVELIPFTYLGWGLDSPPTLRLVTPEARDLHPEAFLWSAPTPPGGLLARVAPEPPADQRIWEMYTWQRWRLVDPAGPEGTQTTGYVSSRPSGEAIPQLLPRRSSRLPHFIVGEKDGQELARRQSQGAEIVVEGSIASRYEPDAAGTNVSARWAPPGTAASPEVVVCAHYDTVYNSAGAYDNGSGSALLLELAHALVGLSAEEAAGLPAIRFIWFGAEELGLSGSRAYVRQREEAGTLGQVGAVLNLDGFGRNDPLELWAGPEDFAQAAWDLAVEASRCWTPAALPISTITNAQASTPPPIKLLFPPPPGSDHTSFYEKGIPSVMLTFNDQPIIHSPRDVFDPRMLANMVRGGRIALTLLTGLAAPASSARNR